ncbi:MAG: hypothetical protein IKN55_06140, partial [Oscillospiraceae bacterium]|nr:hypothetical protein [Oscillospiraceae bacterium]
AARFFVRLYRNDAAGLAPSKEFLCKMTEKMQADAPPSRQAGFVRCCLKCAPAQQPAARFTDQGVFEPVASSPCIGERRGIGENAALWENGVFL